MVKSPVSEIMIAIANTILVLGSIAMMIAGLVLSIQENWQEGVWILIIVGAFLLLFTFPGLLFWIKKIKCNKVDGNMLGYTCVQTQTNITKVNPINIKK